jgi:hypothetical protein
MTGQDDSKLSEAPWVEPLCSIASRWRQPGTTIRGFFSEAAPEIAGRSSCTRLVRARLDRDPELVEAWQNYSWDKRGSPSPYLYEGEVGYFDGSVEMWPSMTTRSMPAPTSCSGRLHGFFGEIA